MYNNVMGVQISFWDNVFVILGSSIIPKWNCWITVVLLLIFWGISNCFPSRLNQFTSANHAQEVPFHCGLICIFLINDIQYLLIPVDHLYVFIEKNIHSDFGPFFNYFFLLLLSGMSSLCILDVTLYDLQSIFSYSVGCVFILLMVFFTVQKLLIWYSPTCLFCFLFFLVSDSKHHCQDLCQGVHHLCFLPRSFMTFSLRFTL